MAEKIHSRLDFPESIYMDRYMRSNKSVTRAKREEVRALKERQTQLKNKLSQFTNYSGSSQQAADSVSTAGKLTLPEVLQLTMDFVTSGSRGITARWDECGLFFFCKVYFSWNYLGIEIEYI